MNYLLLVNKKNPVPEGFYPGLSKADGKYCEEKCAKAYLQMKAAAMRHGLKIKLLSGYRSAAYQKILFLREVNKLKSIGLSDEEAYFKANESVALPGFSEHNTGLGLDIVREDDDDVYEEFEKTEEFLWLIKNCADFGFILRYPEGKTEITGYIYEPWHFRYVDEYAVKIKNSGKTLEEYLTYRK